MIATTVGEGHARVHVQAKLCKTSALSQSCRVQSAVLQRVNLHCGSDEPSALGQIELWVVKCNRTCKRKQCGNALQ